MLFRNLMGALLRLARERDMGAQVGGIVTQVEEQEDCGDPDMWGGESWGWELRVLDQQNCKNQIWLVVTGGHGMGYFLASDPWILTASG